MVDLAKVLEIINDRERFQAVQLITGVVKNNEQERLSCDDLVNILQKVPNFAQQTVVHLKPWISTDIDFTRVNRLLDTSTDKNSRIEILGDLISISVDSVPQLRCSDIRSILSTLPQRFAEKGLKILSRLILPDLDLHRVQLVFECVMVADQPKVLSTLLSASTTLISSMNELRAIIEKMDQPFRGLELLMDRIDPSIDFNKLSVVLSLIPVIRRLDVVQLFTDKTSTEQNSSPLSTFDLRSILMLMEASTIIDTLRLLLNKYEPSTLKDLDRIIECFSEANKPIVETILNQKFTNTVATTQTTYNSTEYIQ